MDDAYEQGKRDGRIEALERITEHHDIRFDAYERRLQIAERILYGLIGSFILINFLPELKRLFI